MWNEARPPGSPVRVWRDWALVCALVPAAVLEGVLRPGLPWLSAAVTVVLVPSLLWRRSRPLLMLAICFAVTSVAPRPQPYALVFVLILVYAVARWGSGREVVAGFALTIAAIAVPAALHGMAASDVVGAFAVTVTALALGVAFRYRARARMRELDQVKLLEREQLARDLHDTVAHHVSAMAIRAQAGLARPDTALDALRVIEEEAGRTLEEMRGMVRILRTDGWESAGRGFADLAGLSGDGGGPAVDVEVSGDLDGVAPTVEAAIYRIAQESVTNARRHARHATRIRVRVEAGEASVRLDVSDDGSARPATTQGYGLLGMAERAVLLGGTCTAGPAPGQGWTVTAELPRGGTA